MFTLTAAVAVAAGVLAPVALAVGAPASGPMAASLTAAYVGAPTAGSLGAALTSAESVGMSTDQADAALEEAEGALDAASAVRAEVVASGLDLGGAADIDTADLRAATARLEEAPTVPVLLFPELGADATAHAKIVTERVATVREALAAARAQRAAEEAAAEAQRQAEAAAAAEAQRQAEILAAVNTPDGAKAYAAQLAAERYAWGSDQFSCLASLWQRESSWNYQALNASSGATGIPQALPGSKMASFGGDWATNAATQIAWGLDYIDRAYGSPCAAWGHSQATNWY
ncbi:phospholipase [Microbacterium sp. RD1]|uniref:aggregation-promoting factor C-terminal-like domain-containing protein n=1 Tax=Microbacterium sp. RD1 TaxID=3457313 RepID=UPI003FA52B99